MSCDSVNASQGGSCLNSSIWAGWKWRWWYDAGRQGAAVPVVLIKKKRKKKGGSVDGSEV